MSKVAPKTNDLGFRLYSQDYTGWRVTRGNDPHPPKITQDFPTRAEAENAKQQLMRQADDKGRTVISTITPVPLSKAKAGAWKAEKIGPGHPNWQGLMRLTK